MRFLVFPLFGGVRGYHLERVPRRGPLLVVANHVSHADPPIIGSMLPRRLRYMAQADLFKIFGFSWLIKLMGAFEVKRGEPDVAAIRKALEFLAKGEALLIFPEGRRGDGKRLLPAQKGVVLLVAKSDPLVLPVGICRTSKLLPRGAKFPKRHKVKVIVGKPFRFSELKERFGEKEAKEIFGGYIMERIHELLVEGGENIEPAPKASGLADASGLEKKNI